MEALRWLHKGANQEFSRTQCNLGAKHEQGRGVAKNDVTAARFSQVAAQGFDEAQ